jgi:hypothetical protein
MIDDEKRRDRFIRRVSIMAWSVTFGLVLLLAVLVGLQVAEMWKAFGVGTLPFMTVVGSVMPLISVLLLLSVLIATLSTVGIFLRLRTASLAEIQLRLAALEEMLASRPGSQQD